MHFDKSSEKKKMWCTSSFLTMKRNKRGFSKFDIEIESSKKKGGDFESILNYCLMH